MALIWAEEQNGATLAAAATRLFAAQRRQTDPQLSPAERVAAFSDALAAGQDYQAKTDAAEAALAALGPRTHLLIIGVGAYQSPKITPVTTSVYGAYTMADFALTEFVHEERPLGSVELVVSPGVVGDYQPSAGARARLGLPPLTAPVSTIPTPSDAVVTEPALMANIQAAFDRWLARARRLPDNAALLYVSSHGVWLTNQIVLPEDAILPAPGQQPRNLIDLSQTLTNMFNSGPEMQCFFVDACQELNQNLLLSISSSIAETLYNNGNDPLIDRDASLFSGSRPGRKAYGPSDAAPFFTQELIQCLKNRGAASELEEGIWSVTAYSLAETLKLAALYRGEAENMPQIRFADERKPSALSKEICRIHHKPQVFASVECVAHPQLSAAHWYLQDAHHNRFPRRFPAPASKWSLPMDCGTYIAGAEFDTGTPFAVAPQTFNAAPPFGTVRLRIAPVAPPEPDATGGPT